MQSWKAFAVCPRFARGPRAIRPTHPASWPVRVSCRTPSSMMVTMLVRRQMTRRRSSSQTAQAMLVRIPHQSMPRQRHGTSVRQRVVRAAIKTRENAPSMPDESRFSFPSFWAAQALARARSFFHRVHMGTTHGGMERVAPINHKFSMHGHGLMDVSVCWWTLVLMTIWLEA